MAPSGSPAGYRVRAKLAFLPAQTDAVGCTSQITGSASIGHAGTTITIAAATFNALKSDRSMRDEKSHSIGLESDRYPTATFSLAHPVALPTSSVEGHVAQALISGTFQIHGVTRSESLPVEFTLTGGVLSAAGALRFPWSEFAMTAPSIGGFVNVTGTATMEFDLRLAPS